MRGSVVIPAYNAADTIKQAIVSACLQTERDIEIIVVDDCSTDNTGEVIHHLAADDGRIRPLRTKYNGGPSVARNMAIEAASGDWIFILDSDDRFHPERVETLLRLAAETGADFVADNLMLCYQDGSTPDTIMLPSEAISQPRPISFAEFMEHSLGRRGVARGVSWVGLKPAWRRDFLQRNGLRYDERCRWGEDYVLYVESFLHDAALWVTPAPMYDHLIRDGSLTDHPRPDDLWHTVEFDRTVLRDARVASNTHLRQAVERHLEAHERWFHYQRFAEAIKSGHPVKAAWMMAESIDGAHHIMRAVAANTVLDTLAYLRRLHGKCTSFRRAS